MGNRKSKTANRLNPSGAPAGPQKPLTDEEAIERSAQMQVAAIEQQVRKNKLVEAMNKRVEELCKEKGINKPTETESIETLVQSNLDNMRMERLKKMAQAEAERRFAAEFPA